MSGRVEFEGELAVVIKKRASNLSKKEVPEHLLGYACFNDVTARDLQKKDGQWSRAKGFDTFAPMGPWIVTDLNSKDLSIESYLNGELRQSASASDMIFDVPFLVSHISKVMTLEPGDVITTGTPKGVGLLNPGDVIDIKIEGIGILRNMVESEG
jgi:2-keto-4-pentenoate hydratase/2-oxohepta-3-ene-1,7-dioic acid hydratase in catechol pathway